MKAQTSADLKLYHSHSVACSYLPDRLEKQLFMILDQSQMAYWADQLNRLGFRRSMNSVYLPACEACKACRSIRVKIGDFRFSRNQKKLLKRHATLEVRQEPLQATPENFLLFQRYLSARHPESDMNDIDMFHYTQLIETAPDRAFAHGVYLGERLLGTMIVDHFSDGFSAVYSFYDPDRGDEFSLGKFMILALIRMAQDEKLPYVYLGYYVAGSPKMAYKAQFTPLEEFDGATTSWIAFTP